MKITVGQLRQLIRELKKRRPDGFLPSDDESLYLDKPFSAGGWPEGGTGRSPEGGAGGWPDGGAGGCPGGGFGGCTEGPEGGSNGGLDGGSNGGPDGGVGGGAANAQPIFTSLDCSSGVTSDGPTEGVSARFHTKRHV